MEVRAAAGDAQATVTWQAPASTGSSTVTDYEVTSSPGGKGCLVKAPTLSCTVTGLTNGTAYTFTVKALSGGGWSAASAPSNAVTPSNSPPSPLPQPLPNPLGAGDSQLQVNGVPNSNVTVEPNINENGLDVKGDGWTMTLDGLGPNGKPLNLGRGGVLILDAERDVQTTGTGFRGDSSVAVYLDPPVLAQGAPTGSWLRDLVTRTTSGVLLGALTVRADGTYAGTVTLPAGLEPGDHVVQAVGVGVSGQTRAMSIGVIVQPWITLDKGKRSAAGLHDRITASGDSAGIVRGSRLTPVIRYQGQATTSNGKAVISVGTDGTFRWTRQIRKDKGLTAFVTWTDVESNRVYWAKVR
jgi:hypothetical protein